MKPGMRQPVAWVLGALLFLGTASTPAAGAAAAPLPSIGPALPGVNDAGCRPRADRPPVILVHGTFMDSTSSWGVLAPLLQQDGFCVFALDYGDRGTRAVDASADELAALTRQVLDATAAPRVSFVGHSQGGLLARWTVKSRGFHHRTQDIVGLAPSHHGTTLPLASLVATLGCAACADQQAGSAFLTRANAAPEAPSEHDHTVVTTTYDEVVTPPDSQALRGPTVGNVVLQDQCTTDLADHLGILYDPVALAWVRAALLRGGPADPLARADCTGRTLPAERPGAPNGADDPGAAAGGDPAAQPVRLVLRSTRLRVSRSGRTVPVRVRCDGPADARCVSLIRLRRGRAVLATLRAQVPARYSATLTLVLTRTGRAVGRRARGAAVPVSLRATTQGGDPRADERALTLRR